MPDGDPPPAPPPPPGDPLAFLHSGAGPAPVDGPRNLGETRGSSAVPVGAMKRPAGLVWIVFYWGICGVLGIFGGLMVTYGASFIGGMSQSFEGAFHSRRSDEAAIAVELMGLGGLLAFHYSLLLELACYGLWTFRRWGLSLAKILAVVQLIGGLIGLVAALVMRTGIVVTLAGLAISVGIVIYLFGSSNLSERLQQVFSRVRRADGRTWEGYE